MCIYKKRKSVPGSPVTFTSYKKFAPALILIGMRFVLSIFGAKFLAFATIGPTESDSSPGPALFTARTRNSYACPSVKSGTVAVVLPPGTSNAFSQPPNLSFFSIIYAVIGAPPSSFGGVQLYIFKKTISLVYFRVCI